MLHFTGDFHYPLAFLLSIIVLFLFFVVIHASERKRDPDSKETLAGYLLSFFFFGMPIFAIWLIFTLVWKL